ISEAVEVLVDRLKLSGLCGFDFMIAPSGRAYLLELNPRGTPICHLPIADGTHLPSALYRDMTGSGPAYRPQPITGAVIALFPTEWRRDKASPYLDEVYHDYPRDQPLLVAEEGLSHLVSGQREFTQTAAGPQKFSPAE